MGRIAAAILVGLLAAASLTGCRAATASRTVVSNHALSGVVKSIDATKLVITRPGKTPGEITFGLSPTTHREGPIGAGAAVQVRYRTERRTLTATAILASPRKQPKGEKAR